jgi:hypothetical protein
VTVNDLLWFTFPSISQYSYNVQHVGRGGLILRSGQFDIFSLHADSSRMFKFLAIVALACYVLCDMIYLLIAVGLTAGGSSTVHIYT